MVFSFDEDRKILATLESDDRRETYECVFQACNDPVCKCTVLQIDFVRPSNGEPHPASHRMALDVVRKEFAFGDIEKVPPEDLKISQLVLSQLEDQDLFFLREKHFQLKTILTETCPVESINVKFNYNDIENKKTMCAYNHALPFGEYISAAIDGKKYLVFDQYCLLSDCPCTNLFLNFTLMEDGKQNSKISFSALLNYKQEEWSVDRNSPTSIDLEMIRTAIEEQIPNFYSLIHKRHTRLKSIYANCKEKRFAARQQTKRNDPCPCGSGKRYKNCCLKAA